MGPPVTGSTFSALAPLVLAAFTAEVRSLKACRWTVPSNPVIPHSNSDAKQSSAARLVGCLCLGLVVLVVEVHLQPQDACEHTLPLSEPF